MQITRILDASLIATSLLLIVIIIIVIIIIVYSYVIRILAGTRGGSASVSTVNPRDRCFSPSDRAGSLVSFRAQLSAYRKERVSISVQTRRAWSITGRRGRGLRGMFIGHRISCYPARCRIAAHRENHNNARIVIPVHAGTDTATSRFTHRITCKRWRLRRMQRSSSVSDSIHGDKRSYLSCKLIPLSIGFPVSFEERNLARAIALNEIRRSLTAHVRYARSNATEMSIAAECSRHFVAHFWHSAALHAVSFPSRVARNHGGL